MEMYERTEQSTLSLPCFRPFFLFLFLHSFPLSWQILWYWIICVIMSLRHLCTRHGAWEKKRQTCRGLNGKCLKPVMSRRSLPWDIVAVLRRALTKHAALKKVEVFIQRLYCKKWNTAYVFFLGVFYLRACVNTNWLSDCVFFFAGM